MPAAKRKRSRSKEKPTVVVQASTRDGSLHMVGIGNLRVIITHEDGSWFARGLEIDYAAQGDSLSDVKCRFYEGLKQTVRENLKAYGDVSRILKVAPPEVWTEYFTNAQALRKIHSQVSTHELQIAMEALPADLQSELPFEGISYIPTAAQAAEDIRV